MIYLLVHVLRCESTYYTMQLKYIVVDMNRMFLFIDNARI